MTGPSKSTASATPYAVCACVGLGGLVLSAVGMALFPSSARFGIAGIIVAIVVLYTGINIQRSPFQALVADAVPSRHRSLATGSVTFQMCVGAIVFLMLGRALGMQVAFLIAAGTVLIIAAGMRLGIREPAPSGAPAADATFRSLFDAAKSAVRGTVPGMRAIFVASLLLQLTFQTFTTWFALHGTERFGVRPEDVTIGFIAWAVGGAVGDPMNGAAFDLFASYRPLFLMMAGYTALAFVAVLFIPRGAGEADTGPATA